MSDADAGGLRGGVATGDRLSTVQVDIVVPVYNEERSLETSIRRLRAYLNQCFPLSAVITIADNASTDGTLAIAQRLSGELRGVRALHLDRKGRGGALRKAWLASEAEVVAYMDVDLSTDLDALLPLVAPLVSGHSDISIGSRLAPGAKVVRGPKRELISRSYNLVIRAMLQNHFSDAQCGFKAMRQDASRKLVPLVVDDGWFFDTELLVLAEHNGLRIHEVPVDWTDHPDSRVDLIKTTIDDLKGLWRVFCKLMAGNGRLDRPLRDDPSGPAVLARFTGVGVISTTLYLILFLILRNVVGSYGANVLALAVCTAGNALAHSRFTFGARGPFRPHSTLVAAVSTFLTSVAFTTLALFLAGAVDPGSRLFEVIALIIGTGAAALVRFLLLRGWVFRRHVKA